MTGRIVRLVVALLVFGSWASLPAVHAQDAKDLDKKLKQKITLDKGIDANTSLKDALEFVTAKIDVTIVVDSRAFLGQGVQKVEEQPVKLKAVKDVALGTVLQMLLDQVDATYKIQKGRLIVVPKTKK